MSSEEQLSVVEEAGVWCLRGSAVDEVGLVNEFLAYLANRNFSPRTCRAYAYDLLAFMRWLVAEGLALSDVDVDVMLRFLTACREATPRGRPGGNVAGCSALRARVGIPLRGDAAAEVGAAEVGAAENVHEEA